MSERFTPDCLTVKELVPGTHPEFHMFECTLKAGCRWEPELYPLADRMQMFFFLNETGYVATAKKAWMISACSLFTPNYDKEAFWIEAGEKDLTFIRFTGVMNAYDQKEYIDYHIVLPCLRKREGSFRFTEYCTGGLGSTIESRRLVLDTAFGRWFVGMDEGEGSGAFVGAHVQPHFQQWNYALPGSEFTCVVNGEERAMHGGEACFIPKGAESSAKTEDGKSIRYLWIKFASEGFPVGADGYPGSEEK